MKDICLIASADKMGGASQMDRKGTRLSSALSLLCGMFLCGLPLSSFASAGNPPPCKGALFQSPWDHQITANLLVKRGEPCQITLRIDKVKEIAITRNPKRGKIEPVAETANVIYTPNNQTTGRDRFVYRSTRMGKDDREMTQTIIVEVEILSQSDYPYHFAVVDTGLPPPPPPFAKDQPPPAKAPPK